MKMKKLWTLLMGVVLTAMLVVPVLAAELKARVKTTDADANTVTVVEAGKDYVLSATPDTKFLTSGGTPLADGIKSADLKAGRRVVVNYEKQDDKLVLTSIQIRK